MTLPQLWAGILTHQESDPLGGGNKLNVFDRTRPVAVMTGWADVDPNKRR